MLSIIDKILVVVVIIILTCPSLRCFLDPRVNTHLVVMFLIPGWAFLIKLLHETNFKILHYFTDKTLSIVVKILLVVAIMIGAFVTFSCLFTYQSLRTKQPEVNLPLVNTDLVMMLTASWVCLIMVCYGKKYIDTVIEQLL